MLAGGKEMRHEEFTLDCALSCKRELRRERVRYSHYMGVSSLFTAFHSL